VERYRLMVHGADLNYLTAADGGHLVSFVLNYLNYTVVAQHVAITYSDLIIKEARLKSMTLTPWWSLRGRNTMLIPQRRSL
jgi:hypothetical protein